MLRLPKFEIARPATITEAVEVLMEGGEGAQIIAGGTDLVPNMKHELFTPDLVVSLEDIPELTTLRENDDGSLAIGAMVRLAQVADDERVRANAPALGQAASVVAGPQLRTMGTLGGNVMLDTRCQWYNQTYFWRKSLGFCLKKDGSICHVVAGGKRCVAAASNDTAAALGTLGALLIIEGPSGRRELPIDELWKADGIFNKNLAPGEILVEVQIPRQAPGHRGAYGKLRDRNSIDFPLLGVAARLDLAEDGSVADADVVAIALAARPVRVKGASEELAGTTPGTGEFDEAVSRVGARAYKQCKPLPNIPGDDDYRKEMVPVVTCRTLRAAATRSGPAHPI